MARICGVFLPPTVSNELAGVIPSNAKAFTNLLYLSFRVPIIGVKVGKTVSLLGGADGILLVKVNGSRVNEDIGASVKDDKFSSVGGTDIGVNLIVGVLVGCDNSVGDLDRKNFVGENVGLLPGTNTLLPPFP
mmetsp:Transcript_2958/g.3490  ORF Transcript_2958/g.3490 Transcript_2958/m.3490 type:complete len:133 (-) Transcript_2958:142-540(-)